MITPNALDAVTLQLYNLLDIETINIMYDGKPYTTFATDAAKAIIALECGPATWGKLSRRTPIAVMTVPRWQPAVTPIIAEFYAALGIRTTTLVIEGVQYTFLVEGDDILAAMSEFKLRPGTPAAAAAAAKAAAGAKVCPNPTEIKVKVKGLCLKRWYAGAFPPEARAVAMLARAQYVPVTGPGAVAHWVLLDAKFAETVVAELKLCA